MLNLHQPDGKLSYRLSAIGYRLSAIPQPDGTRRIPDLFLNLH
jgi:hypothetical protein